MLFKYLTFCVPQDELQACLTTHGLEGWRLHTCDAVPTMGPHGSGELWVFVVMDQAFQDEDEVYDDPDLEQQSEGLAMKG